MKLKIRYLNVIGFTLGKKTEEIEVPEKTSVGIFSVF